MRLLAGLLLVAAWLLAAPAQAKDIQVLVVTNDFVMPSKIAALNTAAAASNVRFRQVLVRGDTLPPNWADDVDLILLDTPRPSDAEQVLAATRAALDAGTVAWAKVGGGALEHGHLADSDARRLTGYYANGGAANFATLARWLVAWARDDPARNNLPPPERIGELGYYRGPRQPILSSPEQLHQAWSATGEGHWPRIGVLVAANTVSSLQTEVLDALIEAGRRQRLAVFGVWLDQQRDDGLLRALDGIAPTALVNLTHLQNGSARAGEFERLDVPVLQGLNYRQGGIAQWRAANSGVPMALLATFVAVPETWGTSDPIVVSANEAGTMLPIPEQVEALVAKLAALAQLRARPAQDKRVALMFWNAPDGEKNLSASHLNVPRSIAALTGRLKQAGYDVSVSDEVWLIDRAQRMLGGYYRTTTLEDLLARDLAVAFPVARYRAWLATLPKARQDELVSTWGDPAHHPAVRLIDGQPCFLIPRLQLGHLLVMPQPPRAGQVGEATHDLGAVPSHSYLVAYLYLREAYRADALIHLGTHGTQEWTPGKDRGLSATDYPWLAVGPLPVFYPYIQDNVGEAMQAKRRGRAVTISHQTPAFAPSGLYDELRDLHQLVHEYQQLDDGPVRDETAARLRELANSSGIAGDMRWNAGDMQAKFPMFLAELHDHLHDLARRQLPLGLHTFGEPAAPEHRLMMVMQQLGAPYLAALGVDPREVNTGDVQAIRGDLPYRTLERYLRGPGLAEALPEGALGAQLSRARQLDAALSDPQEVESLLRGLAGGFVPPGAGGDPIRSPDLRGGRNLYAFEPDRIPTQAAFDAGRVALDQVLQSYRAEHGQLPEKLAISLWSSEAIRHLGILEAQVLHAMGLKPRWDEAGKVKALDIVADEELSHPRIDVVIQATSVYRDQFDPFLRLLADAFQRLSALPESPNNPIARNTRLLREKLQRQGTAADRADALAALRIFSNAPGSYGSGLSDAVLEGDQGADKDEAALAQGFLERLQYGYDVQGVAQTLPGGNLLAEQLHGVQAAVLSRSSNLHGLLSTDHPFEYLGGLALAVRHLDGTSPALYVSDLRQRDPSTTTATRFMADELRSGALNPQWIAAMQQEGYAGTLEVLKVADNLFGWSMTAPDTVRAEQWQALHDTYVRDSRGLGVSAWFEQDNPTAQVQLIQRLEEAIQRGRWNPDARTRAELADRLANLMARSQPKPATASTGLPKTSGFGLQARAAAAGKTTAAAAAAPASPPAASQAAPPSVRGQVLRQVPPPPQPAGRLWTALLSVLCLLMAGAAWQARSNARRPLP